MKIRSGFVSNSSSSSFIIIGKKVNIDNVTEEDINDKTFVCIGMSLGDGDDIFYVNTMEKIWFLRTAKKTNFKLDSRYIDFDEFEIYEIPEPKSITEDRMIFDSKNLPEGEIVALSYYKDYNASQTIEDLFNKYLYENDMDTNTFHLVYNRYKRKEKLKKIEENEN